MNAGEYDGLMLHPEAQIPMESLSQEGLSWFVAATGSGVIAQLSQYFIQQAIHRGEWSVLTSQEQDYPVDIAEQRSSWIAYVAVQTSGKDAFTDAEENGYIVIDIENCRVAPTLAWYNKFVAPFFSFTILQ